MVSRQQCATAGVIICVASLLRGGEYEVGGPLAGLTLPVSTQSTGPGPELELYPGSVEHFRSYFMKYLPVRSFFDRQSQVTTWVGARIPGRTPRRRSRTPPPSTRWASTTSAPTRGISSRPCP